jgi:cyclomaltodextrinase
LALLATFAVAVLAYSCKQSNIASGGTIKPHKVSNIVGLATPIQLDGEENTIITEDYFLDVRKIGSVEAPEGMTAALSPDKKAIALKGRASAPLAELKVVENGLPYSILLKMPNKRSVTFALADKGYGKVQMKGEMNAWNPGTANFTKNAEGKWTYTFALNPGRYQYLYMVDDKEMKDPDNQNLVSNGSGGQNSLLVVEKPDPAKLSTLSTLKHQSEKITLGFDNKPTEIFAFWENYRIPVTMAGDTATFTIPTAAETMPRSTIRVWSYNGAGLSNDLLIPLQNRFVVDNPKILTRHDKEAQIMYFALVDRFFDGNKGNNHPVKDDRLKPLTNYMGGDLAGITQKIKEGYFKSLNINTIWLSPITQNPLAAYQEYPEPRYWYSGYHGYWPISSSQIDFRFGTDAEMNALVDAAHANGINIILDYVCNHVHEEHPMYKQHPEWATQLKLPDGRMNIRIWDEQRLTTWFDTFMPSLNLEDPKVADVQVDSTMFWLKKFDLDGYRHDATKHIPTEFWRKLTRKLKEDVMGPQNKLLYQIGETYGSRELTNSYIASGLLDAQFDFNLYFDAREVFARDNTSFRSLANSLDESFSYFGQHSTMGNITGNHDQARFVSLASGALSFEEDPKMAGFTRNVGVKDPIGYNRLLQEIAFATTIPGVPVIYYGDEIGMPGAGDPDSRRMMRFGQDLLPVEQWVKKTTEKLTTVRANRLSLMYGETKILYVDDEALAFMRTYFDEVTIVAFNKSREKKDFSFQLPDRFHNKNFKGIFVEGSSVTKSSTSTVDDKGNPVNKAYMAVHLPPVSFEVAFDAIK